MLITPFPIEDKKQMFSVKCEKGIICSRVCKQLNLHETEGAMDLCHEVLKVLLPQDGVFR